MGKRAARRMTVAEFLVWQASQAQRYELVDGEPVAMTGARVRHDRVTGNAFSEIRQQMRSAGSPCDAFTADIGICTPAGNVRRPNLSVLCPPVDEEATTSESPRLVLEVLSESTERVDRLIKLDEYRAIDGLDYIVIVDPTRVEVGVWSRNTARVWRGTTFRELQSVIEMPALGIAISLAALYERIQVISLPRLKLVWEDDAGGVPDDGIGSL